MFFRVEPGEVCEAIVYHRHHKTKGNRSGIENQTSMTTQKKKYNTTTKTKEWFPFPKYLFETARHPILLSKAKCSSSIEALFCQQELEQINGITNSLQCEQRDAVRIALFEAIKHAELAHKKSYAKGKAGSSEKGHEEIGRAHV